MHDARHTPRGTRSGAQCLTFRLARRYYSWVKRADTRLLTIAKGAGDSLGIGIKGTRVWPWASDNRVAYVLDGSPCAALLHAGDIVHLVNGRRLNGSSAAQRIRKAKTLYLLVSTPTAAEDGTDQLEDPAQTGSGTARVAPSPTELEWHAPAQEIKISRVPIRMLPTTRMRRVYKKAFLRVTRRPHFKSLPDALFWPNPEVLILSCFATGMLQCASSVFAAATAGYATMPTSLAIAIAVILILTVFYIHQCTWLVIFYMHHLRNCWVPAEEPEDKAEVDDPFFALLTNLSRGCFKAKSRELGSFEPPEEDTEEPARTERALGRFFTWRCLRFREINSGDAFSYLPSWLGDSSGSGKFGVFYMFFMIALQLLTGVIMGIFFSVPWGSSSNGGKALLTILLSLQLVGAVWSLCLRTANDKLDGLEKALIYFIEAAATALMLASAYVAEAGGNSSDDADSGEPGKDLANLKLSLQLATTSASILMGAIFFPLGITFYNSFIVPIVGLVWKSDGDCREIATQMVLSCILMPYEIMTSLLGFSGGGDLGSVLGELEGSMVELGAASTTVGEEAGKSGPSKGKLKRLKKETFLARVRGKKEAKLAADVETPSSQPARLIVSRGFVRVVSGVSSLAQASRRSRQVSAADEAEASNGGGGGDSVLEQHNAETPAPSEETRSISGGGDAHPVLQQLHPDNTFRVRQRAAHTLAALLACDEPEQALLQQLQVHNPMHELVALGVESEERNDALTLQLVFSCIANLAARRVPVIDGSAVGGLIARTLTRSSSSDVESQLLGYVLTASNNLSADVLDSRN